MAMTYEDIANRLRQIDEISLLELLEISSEDIVDRFPDRIEENLEKFEEDFEDDFDNNNME